MTIIAEDRTYYILDYFVFCKLKFELSTGKELHEPAAISNQTNSI